MRTKKVTITFTPQQQEEARKLSTKLFGKSNISGLFAYLIEKEKQNEIQGMERRHK